MQGFDTFVADFFVVKEAGYIVVVQEVDEHFGGRQSDPQIMRLGSVVGFALIKKFFEGTRFAAVFEYGVEHVLLREIKDAIDFVVEGIAAVETIVAAKAFPKHEKLLFSEACGVLANAWAEVLPESVLDMFEGVDAKSVEVHECEPATIGEKHRVSNFLPFGVDVLQTSGKVAVQDLMALDGSHVCLLYTSDAADDLLCVALGGRRIIKKKNK